MAYLGLSVGMGDVIVAINGKQVESVNELFLLLEQYRVGDTVAVTVMRGGARQQFKIVLEPAG